MCVCVGNYFHCLNYYYTTKKMFLGVLAVLAFGGVFANSGNEVSKFGEDKKVSNSAEGLTA